MTTMRCGVAAVEALRAVGVTTIFGLMGSSTLELYDALYDATDVTYIGVRHCWPKRVSRRCQLWQVTTLLTKLPSCVGPCVCGKCSTGL